MRAVVFLREDESVDVLDVSTEQGALEERFSERDVQTAALLPDVTLETRTATISQSETRHGNGSSSKQVQLRFTASNFDESPKSR